MKNNIWAATQRFFRVLLKMVYRIEVIYQAEIPKTGSYIAVNHPGLIDGVLALVLVKVPIRVLAKIELFTGAFGWLFRAGRAIETDWHSPDRSALKEMSETVASGTSVAIFPEGTRCSGTYKWLRAGLAYSLLSVNRPIYPVAIFGSRKAGQSRSAIPLPGAKITIVVGAPLVFEDSDLAQYDSRQIRQINTLAERLRQHLEVFVQDSAALTGLANLPRESGSSREI